MPSVWSIISRMTSFRAEVLSTSFNLFMADRAKTIPLGENLIKSMGSHDSVAARHPTPTHSRLRYRKMNYKRYINLREINSHLVAVWALVTKYECNIVHRISFKFTLTYSHVNLGAYCCHGLCRNGRRKRCYYWTYSKDHEPFNDALCIEGPSTILLSADFGWVIPGPVGCDCTCCLFVY